MSIRQWSGGDLGITATQIAGIGNAMEEEITVDARDASDFRSMTARAADLPEQGLSVLEGPLAFASTGMISTGRGKVSTNATSERN